MLNILLALICRLLGHDDVYELYTCDREAKFGNRFLLTGQWGVKRPTVTTLRLRCLRCWRLSDGWL